MKVDITAEEARLVAIHRAVLRSYDVLGVVRAQDVSMIADYLRLVVDTTALDEQDSSYIDAFLDGVVAGFAASRLITAGVDPEHVEYGQEAEQSSQTGVDPTTGEVRH